MFPLKLCRKNGARDRMETVNRGDGGIVNELAERRRRRRIGWKRCRGTAARQGKRRRRLCVGTKTKVGQVCEKRHRW